MTRRPPPSPLTVDADTGTTNVQDSIAEGGGVKTVRVTATLTGATRFEAAQTVTVKVGKAADSAAEGTDYTAVANQTLTIAATAASGHVDFPLTPTDDAVDEVDETLSIEGTLSGVTVTPTSLTLTDDDTRGITVSAALAGVTVDEADDPLTLNTTENQATYTVVLDSAPTGTVSISLASGDTDVATVAPASLTFDDEDWNTAQTVTVTAVDDDLDNANNRRTTTITHTVSAATTDYAGQTADPVTVTVTDDEGTPTATLVLTPSSIDESGAANRSTVTATLSGPSGEAVALTVAVPNGAPVSQSGTVLTIVAGATESTGAVTLTAVDNDVDAVDATVAVSATASGGHGVAAPDPVTLTVEDDDERGITVSATVAGVTVAEADNTETADTTENEATYTVVLDSQPTGTVTVNLESEDTDIATVAPARLSFTTGNWNTAQGVTVTGVADVIDNPNDRRTTDITHTVSAASTDYASETAGNVTVTVTDDDAAPGGITLALDTNGTAAGTPDTVAEGAGATEVTVRATVDGATRYAGAQTVTVSVDDGTAAAPADYAAVADFTITIAAGGAGHSETFTITPVDDVLDEPNETVNVTGAAGSITVTPDVLTITDNDAAPGAVTLTVDADTSANNVQASLAEGGGVKTVRVTATLTGATRFEAARTVTVKVGKAADSAAEGTDYTAVADQAITIAANAASGHVDFPLTPTDDAVDEVDETLSIEGALSGVTVTPTSLTLTDDDTRGITVSAALDGVTVAEADDPLTLNTTENQATYTVVLDSAPTGTVSISLASGDTDVATVAPASLTFDDEDWNTAQTVTVTAVDDDLDNANNRRSATITHTVSAATTDYAGQTADPVTVTVTDNEGTPTATLVLTPSSIDESGAANRSTVTATLSGPSGEAVALTVAVPNGAPVSQSGTVLTIVAGATESTGAVTLTAVDNDVDAVDATVAVSATASGGHGVAAPDPVTLTVEDDDERGITVSAAVAGVTVDEADDPETMEDAENEATYTVVLDSQPTGTVTVNLESEDTDIATVAPARLTFTTGNWNTAQGVTVTGVADVIDNPNDRRTTDITHTVSAASTDYASETAGNVTVTVTDDDAAPGGITLALDTNGTAAGTPDTVAEGAGATEVTVRATVDGATRYAGAQTVTVSVDDGTAAAPADYAAVADFTITIAAGGAGHSETFTITPVDDVLDEPNETVNVTGAAGSITVTPDVLTITDNDAAPGAVTLTVDADTGTANVQASLAEGGGVKTVRVTATLTGATRFEAARTVTVKVGKAADSAAEGTDYTAVADQAITIAATAASGHVDFPLTPTDDAIDEVDETLSIEGALSGVTVTPTSLTLTDDDTRGITVSAALAGVTVDEADNAATPDTTENEATYTVVLDSAPTGTVSISLASGDTDVATVAPASLTFDDEDWNTAQTVTVTAVDDDLDNANNRRSATITHTVSAATTDYAGQTADPVTVTVTDNEGTPTATLVLTPSSIDESGAANRSTVTATLSGASSQAADPDGGGTATGDGYRGGGLHGDGEQGADDCRRGRRTSTGDGDHHRGGQRRGCAGHATVTVSATATRRVTAWRPRTSRDAHHRGRRTTRGITVSAALTGVTVAEADNPVTMEHARRTKPPTRWPSTASPPARSPSTSRARIRTSATVAPGPPDLYHRQLEHGAGG